MSDGAFLRLIVVIASFAFCMWMLDACIDCEKRGGAYVRGAFGFVCVAKR
jgi:hypothetical protein